jgi:hypothetical protein
VKRERKSSSFSRRSLKAPFRAGEDREHAKQEDILMAVVEDDDVEDAPPSHVSTIDDINFGEQTLTARRLCRKSYHLGYFFLPLVWAACAYYFSPKASSSNTSIKTDKVVDEYVSKMKFGVQIYIGVCVLWSLVWYSGAFEYVFGANAWENLSVVRGEWVERIFLAPAS